MNHSPRQSRLADERGFSMFLVLMVLFTSAMFVAAGFAAANGDLPLSGDSKNRKSAYAAAEAGVNLYQHQLNVDNAYWARCTNVPAPNATEPSPVNQKWDGAGTDPRSWRNVPGSSAQYTIELLPNQGSSCVEGDQASFIDPQTGTFRIRATGRPSATSTLRRSIIANFRRRGFLDFLYFTDYETLDPAAYSDQTWANANCADRPRAQRHASCTEITFVSGDRIEGPFHTNDTMRVCGSPVFGRTAADRIEASGPSPGYFQVCSGSPDFRSPFKFGVPKLTMPPSNTALKSVAVAPYLFTGKTTIRLQAATSNMVVTNANVNGGTPTTMGLPGNGVIYVQNGTGTCTTNAPPSQGATYNESNSCGNLYVSGSYGTSLTLAAERDIIIRPTASPNTNPPNGDLVRAGDAVLGLIANNFVRVYKPCSSGTNTTGASGVMPSVTIDAAILSLRHSFIVDNYACGAPLGSLTVNGAIAQKYRGPVGTFSGAGTPASGYLKSYAYDDRLRFRSPPFFLDPVAAAWGVIRSNEQVPAT